jgi:hypothetical protein
MTAQEKRNATIEMAEKFRLTYQFLRGSISTLTPF